MAKKSKQPKEAEKPVAAECPDCDGVGSVECPTCGQGVECEECAGTGEVDVDQDKE